MASVSIVMPAYNAEVYISKAIESVLAQTFNDWELIVVDDASNDNTLQIIKHFSESDSRIKFSHREKNSGTARMPRFEAVNMSSAEWIIALDADDYLAENYIQNLIVERDAHTADIVLAIGYRITESGQAIKTIPEKPSSIPIIMSGKAACSQTIGKWKLCASGMLCRKSEWQKLPLEGNSYMNQDEVDTRLLLLSANIVCLSAARYYYVSNCSSITQKISAKVFDTIDTSYQLISVVEKHFGKDSTEYSVQANQFLVNCITGRMKIYRYGKSLTKQEQKEVVRKIEKYYPECQRLIDVSYWNGLKRFFFLTDFRIMSIVAWIMSKKMQ